ncbi:MAG: DUF2953 domain-containing protein [Lachnospiraceae bacterium]|nr:DUF2953 domain-containing protein [Lachnospiraceae bacterium]
MITILKVAGIILFAICGILILLLMLVLFVPLRYSLRGEYAGIESPLTYAKIRISWLLRLVSVSYSYPDKQSIRVKFLFFTIFDSKRPKKKKKAGKKSATDKRPAKEEKNEVTEANETTEAIEVNKANELKAVNEVKAPAPADEPEEEKPSFIAFLKKIKQFYENIIYTARNFYAKIKDTRQKVSDFVNDLNYYLEILKSDELKKAFSLCTGQLKRILKSIKPRKIRVNLLIGRGDPAATAKILELYSILYPFIGQNISIKPDFDREVINGDFFISGRIASWVVLWSAWKVYSDRNIRKLLKMFKNKPTN